MGTTARQPHPDQVEAVVDNGELETNPHHAKTLAAQLVRHLGIHEARRVCVGNQWDNVLAAIRFHEGESE